MRIPFASTISLSLEAAHSFQCKKLDDNMFKMMSKAEDIGDLRCRRSLHPGYSDLHPIINTK